MAYEAPAEPSSSGIGGPNFLDNLKDKWNDLIDNLADKGVPHPEILVPGVIGVVIIAIIALVFLSGPGGTDIKVTVTDKNGALLDGAQVSIYFGSDLYATKTTKAGVALFTSVPSGKQAEIRVAKTGFDASSTKFTTGQQVPAISLSPSAASTAFKVIANDEAGNPIPGATATVASFLSGDQEIQTTDGFGTATFSKVSGQVTVSVSADNFNSESTTASTTQGTITIVLKGKQASFADSGRKGIITLRVQDASSNPVQAYVSLFTKDDLQIQSGSTDSSGTETFSNVAAGTTFYIFAKNKSNPTDIFNGKKVSEYHTLSNAESGLELTVQLGGAAAPAAGPSSSLTFLVNDESSSPVSGVSVALYDSATNTQQSSDTTDASGSVSFTISRGSFYTTFVKSGFQTTRVSGISSGGTRNVTMEHLTSGAYGIVKVKVIDKKSAIAGATVALATSDGKFTGLTGTTESNGIATFAEVPSSIEGISNFVAKAFYAERSGKSSSFSVSAGQTKDVSVSLDPEKGTINVLVKDWAAKARVPGTTVTAETDDGDIIGTCITGTKGTCDLQMLAETSANLHASASGYLDYFTVPLSVGANEEIDQTIELTSQAADKGVEMRFDGIVGSNVQEVEKLKTYEARFTVTSYVQSNVTGAFIKLGDAGDASSDIAAIMEWRGAPAKASSSDSETAVEPENDLWKWVRFERSKFVGSMQVSVTFKVLPKATVDDKVKFYYRAWSVVQGRYLRSPADDNSGNIDVFTAKLSRTLINISEAQMVCDDSLCLKTVFKTGSKPAVVNGLEVPVEQNVNVDFTINYIGKTARTPKLNFAFQKELQFSNFAVSKNGQQLSPTVLNGNAAATFDLLTSGDQIQGSFSLKSTRPNKHADIDISINSDDGLSSVWNRYLVATGSQQLKVVLGIAGVPQDLITSPLQLKLNEKQDLTVTVTDATQGLPVTDARIIFYEVKDHALGGQFNTVELQGTNVNQAGKNGLYVFKKFSAVSVGSIGLSVENTDRYVTSTNDNAILVTSDTFIDVQPGTISLQGSNQGGTGIAVEPQEITVTSKLSVDSVIHVGESCTSRQEFTSAITNAAGNTDFATLKNLFEFTDDGFPLGYKELVAGENITASQAEALLEKTRDSTSFTLKAGESKTIQVGLKPIAANINIPVQKPCAVIFNADAGSLLGYGVPPTQRAKLVLVSVNITSQVGDLFRGLPDEITFTVNKNKLADLQVKEFDSALWNVAGELQGEIDYGKAGHYVGEIPASPANVLINREATAQITAVREAKQGTIAHYALFTVGSFFSPGTQARQLPITKGEAISGAQIKEAWKITNFAELCNRASGLQYITEFPPGTASIPIVTPSLPNLEVTSVKADSSDVTGAGGTVSGKEYHVTATITNTGKVDVGGFVVSLRAYFGPQSFQHHEITVDNLRAGESKTINDLSLSSKILSQSPFVKAEATITDNGGITESITNDNSLSTDKTNILFNRSQLPTPTPSPPSRVGQRLKCGTLDLTTADPVDSLKAYLLEWAQQPQTFLYTFSDNANTNINIVDWTGNTVTEGKDGTFGFLTLYFSKAPDQKKTIKLKVKVETEQTAEFFENIPDSLTFQASNLFPFDSQTLTFESTSSEPLVLANPAWTTGFTATGFTPGPVNGVNTGKLKDGKPVYKFSVPISYDFTSLIKGGELSSISETGTWTLTRGPASKDVTLTLTTTNYPGMLFAGPSKIYLKSYTVPVSSLQNVVSKPAFVINNYQYDVALSGSCGLSSINKVNVVTIAASQTCNILQNNEIISGGDISVQTVDFNDKSHVILQDASGFSDAISGITSSQQATRYTCAEKFCSCRAVTAALKDFNQTFREHAALVKSKLDATTDSGIKQQFNAYSESTVVKATDLAGCNLGLIHNSLDADKLGESIKKVTFTVNFNRIGDRQITDQDILVQIDPIQYNGVEIPKLPYMDASTLGIGSGVDSSNVYTLALKHPCIKSGDAYSKAFWKYIFGEDPENCVEDQSPLEVKRELYGVQGYLHKDSLTFEVVRKENEKSTYILGDGTSGNSNGCINLEQDNDKTIDKKLWSKEVCVNTGLEAFSLTQPQTPYGYIGEPSRDKCDNQHTNVIPNSAYLAISNTENGFKFWPAFSFDIKFTPRNDPATNNVKDNPDLQYLIVKNYGLGTYNKADDGEIEKLAKVRYSVMNGDFKQSNMPNIGNLVNVKHALDMPRGFDASPAGLDFLTSLPNSEASPSPVDAYEVLSCIAPSPFLSSIDIRTDVVPTKNDQTVAAQWWPT